MKALPKKKQKEMIDMAIKATKNSIDILSHSDVKNNPSIIPTRKILRGRLQAFEAVRDMMAGDNVMIKIYCER